MTFLGGRVIAGQPESGFQSGSDAVFLAAAVPAQPGKLVLELGAGSGTAGLCLAARVPGLVLTGVEIDPVSVELARANAAANGVTAMFVVADIFALPPQLKRDFDQVFCNPPFHGEGQASPDTARAVALMDGGMLQDWLRVGLQRTVSGGYFTTIIRADRMAEACAALPERGLCAFPLWPRDGEAASRVILQVRKGSRAPFALLSGLVLHGADGAWTPAANAVLRDGAALALAGARL